jgi:molybdopterin molybdotransferase
VVIDKGNLKALLPLAEARQHMLAAVTPLGEVEVIALDGLPGRILAEDVVSSLNSPPADNSAMDGYALSLNSGSTSIFKVIGKAMAGTPFDGSVREGEAVRIMTGAEVSVGADTVIMQEDVVRDEGVITLTKPHIKGANIRRLGEDISKGERLLLAGHRVGSVDVGLLATLGLAEVPVVRPLKVALFASGDELRSPGSELGPGDIYDSNRYFLKAMLKRLGCEVIDLGVVADDLGQLRDAYNLANEQADAVITCGGASVGEADYAQQLLAELGQVEFWKVAIKPGKPFIFGKLHNSVFFGLPGNPVSALVTFHQLVLPVLQKMQGQNVDVNQALTLTARSTQEIRRNRQRIDFQRGLYKADGRGGFEVTPDRQQSSGALGSMSRCNCFILVAAGENQLKSGEDVEILPFDSWLR